MLTLSHMTVSFWTILYIFVDLSINSQQNKHQVKSSKFEWTQSIISSFKTCSKNIILPSTTEPESQMFLYSSHNIISYIFDFYFLVHFKQNKNKFMICYITSKVTQHCPGQKYNIFLLKPSIPLLLSICLPFSFSSLFPPPPSSFSSIQSIPMSGHAYTQTRLFYIDSLRNKSA